jgi:hypothetical protein
MENPTNKIVIVIRGGMPSVYISSDLSVSLSINILDYDLQNEEYPFSLEEAEAESFINSDMLLPVSF